MDLDRDLQLKILTELESHYPNNSEVPKMKCYEKGQKFSGNMFYLEEHELLTGEFSSFMSCPKEMSTAQITAGGLDFLEDDGGLKAILSKVTIKFDNDDLQTIIETSLNNKDIPPEKKSEILKTIKSLPSEGIKNLYKHLISYGLDKTPDVADLIQSLSC